MIANDDVVTTKTCYSAAWDKCLETCCLTMVVWFQQDCLCVLVCLLPGQKRKCTEMASDSLVGGQYSHKTFPQNLVSDKCWTPSLWQLPCHGLAGGLQTIRILVCVLQQESLMSQLPTDTTTVPMLGWSITSVQPTPFLHVTVVEPAAFQSKICIKYKCSTKSTWYQKPDRTCKKNEFHNNDSHLFNFYEGYICAPGTVVPMACVCQPQLINGHVLYQLASHDILIWSASVDQ